MPRRTSFSPHARLRSDGEVSSESDSSRCHRGSERLGFRGGENESKQEDDPYLVETPGVNEDNQHAGEQQHQRVAWNANTAGAEYSDRELTPSPGGDELSIDGSVLEESTYGIVDQSVTSHSRMPSSRRKNKPCPLLCGKRRLARWQSRFSGAYSEPSQDEDEGRRR